MATVKNSVRGFTLIELLIAMGIVGILAAIGVTQYVSYRMKAYNAGAQTDLKTFKTAMEAYYAENRSYP